MGWVGVAMGAVFIIGYRLRATWFAPPFIPTVYPLVLGITVLILT